jgi:16S rRNA (cytosine1402-N4)-methyltransferase
MGSYHEPVMLEEVVQSLRCRSGGIYVDGTLGGGGHARAILERSAPDGLLVGIDRDDDAIFASEKSLQPFGRRKILVKGNFADIGNILTNLKIGKVDGVLLDLGVSSHQLDTADRGFSFSLDAPLDMRMDRGSRYSARDLVNLSPEKELKQLIREYGEEPMAGRIARAISAKRESGAIRTTAELADLVCRAVRRPGFHGKIHPATRTFQAIRMAVNQELPNLRRAIGAAVDRLRSGGRLSVISFHSLEDRIVKEAFRSGEGRCQCPPGMPVCRCRREVKLKVLTRKPMRSGADESERNPRARSARLRTAEKI